MTLTDMNLTASDLDAATLRAWLRFANVEFSPRRMTALLAHFGGIPLAILEATDTELENAGCAARHAVRLRDPKYKETDRQVAWVEKNGVRLVFHDDSDYPPLLREIADAPPLLFVRGQWDAAQHSVGMVGSRHATPYGKATAERLAKELAERGVLVVSGGAVGIDAASHRGALAGGGMTLAVLGCGLDVDYPKENRALFEQITAQGALISEYPVGAQPETWRFPRRNRIISGISLGVIVVEAPLKSGALITSKTAAEQGRPVMTVPGNIDRPASVGSNLLLRDGATPILETDDVLHCLGLVTVPARREHQSVLALDSLTENTPAVPAAPKKPLPQLTETQLRLLDGLSHTPRHIDQLAQATGLDAMAASVEMFFLEMSALVRKLPGNLYIRLA